MSIILANGSGLPIVIFYSGPNDAVMPVGVIDYGGQLKTQAKMRRFLLHYLAADNVLVNFHVGWPLAALELLRPAPRVVDLDTVKAF